LIFITLYRSDFFPGLGWMMTRALWDELSVKWPRGYWDDWLREPSQRKGRHFIRPEICRTYHFGTHGVSQGEFQDGFLNDIKLADTYESFTTMDLSYLEKERWDKEYLSAVARAKTVTFETFSSQSNEVKIFYSGFEGGSESFVRVARWAGVMDNIKANVPRTAYKGIVTSYRSGVKIHIVPRQ
jgi:alpha-1,3-mannosyl-glycoprotein beta-1,2-N-acetylglucosaminyltransferase